MPSKRKKLKDVVRNFLGRTYSQQESIPIISIRGAAVLFNEFLQCVTVAEMQMIESSLPPYMLDDLPKYAQAVYITWRSDLYSAGKTDRIKEVEHLLIEREVN